MLLLITFQELSQNIEFELLNTLLTHYIKIEVQNILCGHKFKNFLKISEFEQLIKTIYKYY